ncbi:hypothetical protein HMPREF1051_2446 [Neisseria sicca VK64]|uniref:Uncharacterized protein n=1 Tax=Neisseria sicca VK64 TaxID=1095748 RepID=I2NHA1_NEISI|nr:hypothetical protein HMPREF1051_2446 [Neisseria sicca VK64]
MRYADTSRSSETPFRPFQAQTRFQSTQSMMATRGKSCQSVTNHPPHYLPALQSRIMPYTFATAARASSVRQKRLKYADFQTRENKP